MIKAEAYVAAGARLLDEEIPGWFNRIDDTTLGLESCTRCVLGQLFANNYIYTTPYMAGKVYLKFEGDNVTQAARHGFTIAAFSNIDYQQLTDAWIDEIAKRRAGSNGDDN